ncbi:MULTISPECIES: DUF2933 domain-containing protein [unclassified Sporolactobacillus]|uniref:DUF2933 domain-containing protein n=1 Tax=unclassified Sporolactobacillus TaxID=2628533 RepID=UPI0023688374|nr:DUF2933 domain-containing protein [Sporolactobacillus sp. CQH2019]MDD9148572.1 DUF2933 domain-containing protein [Sporolactobacillus sp. CQH2019]
MDLSWLLLLACPLMMLPMMFMMKGHHSDTDHSEHHKEAKDANELNALKEQNDLLREELQQLKNKE